MLAQVSYHFFGFKITQEKELSTHYTLILYTAVIEFIWGICYFSTLILQGTCTKIPRCYVLIQCNKCVEWLVCVLKQHKCAKLAHKMCANFGDSKNNILFFPATTKYWYNLKYTL